MAAADEVKRIMALTRGDPVKAYELVQSQLSVLVLRTQVMLSLSGIVITVTGFSGRTIAQTSELARNLVASGIVIVLGAAGVAIGGVLRLKWLTQQMTDDTEQTLALMLDMRDQKSRYLNVALLLFMIGFACYCVSIALMLLATQPL
ncbi:MAG: hypothetical protein Q8L48_39860 [Archangium sp.]|nr:hypothetical protein [Archangium sp.]